MEYQDFDNWFKEFIGAPFRWQRRLFKRFVDGNLPPALDLPTGLGKTSVMAIWLLARAYNPALPRRLVYVVDRRAVVDQATREAEKIRNALETPAMNTLRNKLGLADKKLPISTLRGRYLDNREWLSDPTIPAIIVGTIDMIGSRLLFEGYGVSRGMRSFHAGLVGADTLFVLDEAHLCPSFEALLKSILVDEESYRSCVEDCHLIPPFRFLPLSATGRGDGKGAFPLQDVDYSDQPVRDRLQAKKVLAIEEIEPGNKLDEKLVDDAWIMGYVNNRVLVYCNSRKTAQEVEKKLKQRITKEKSTASTELMVGARRVHEREKLSRWLEETGFLSGSTVERTAPVFLVATSAGEVGVDLDADHMVCDLVPFERMVQRFGRVNRLGRGEATILVIAEPPEPPKANASANAKQKYQNERGTFDARIQILKQLPESEGCHDASPGAIVKLKEKAADSIAVGKLVSQASTPEPLHPALTRALVYAWSMTSLREHTGRPEIAPWLRGWIREEAQSMIAWRRYLPWRKSEDRPDPKAVEVFFKAAPVHLSEMLETLTREIVDTLIKRAKAVLKDEGKAGELPALIVLNRAGELKTAFTIAGLAILDEKSEKKDKDNLKATIAGCQLVVSSQLGGLSESGLLDDKHKEPPLTLDEGWFDTDLEAVGYRVCPEEQTPGGDWRIIHRFIRGLDEDDSQAACTAVVVAALRRAGVARMGDPAISRKAQVLAEHLDWTGKAAREIAQALGLPQSYVDMLVIAARAHDLGKNRKQWQNAMNAPQDGRPYAKTRGGGNMRLLGGFRHEFGSLGDVANSPELQKLPDNLQELALHLIAAHHGHARPMIPAIDPDVLPSKLSDRSQQAALRFARLQLEWGPWGLAWWEAIFRAADWRASGWLDTQNPGGNS